MYKDGEQISGVTTKSKLERGFFFGFLCPVCGASYTQITHVLKFIELYTKMFLKSNLLYINLTKKKMLHPNKQTKK